MKKPRWSLGATLGGCCAGVTLVAFLHPHPSLAALVINEFLPDPAGADGGREFVEIMNTGPDPVNLLGVRLEFANGIHGPEWENRWEEVEDKVLGPGSRFLITDRNWLGEAEPDVSVWLGLQNGPDAIRLARDGQALDLVGYGPLTDPEMMEEQAVSLVVGSSLSRRPDGHDTQNNTADFVASEPTPGQPNFHDFQAEVVSVLFEPPCLDRPGGDLDLTLVVRNAGLQDWGWAEVALQGWDQDHPGVLDGCPAGEERTLYWQLSPGSAGNWPLEIALPVGEEPMVLDLHLGRYQVGPGSLVISEVMSVPGGGQGEWIELQVGQEPGLDLGSFSLRDEDGDWHALPSRPLWPGELVLLVQDSLALVEWLQIMEAERPFANCRPLGQQSPFLAPLGGWPGLNNSPADDRHFSDRVQLADSAGTVIDVVELPAQWPDHSSSGTSWERQAYFPRNPLAENWAPSTDQSGSTPGCANSFGGNPQTEGAFSISPSYLDPTHGPTVQHFLFEVPPGADGFWLRVFDTWGDLQRDLGGELAGPGPRDIVWDGRDDEGRYVTPGLYVVLLEVRGRGGEVVQAHKKLSAVGGGN